MQKILLLLIFVLISASIIFMIPSVLNETQGEAPLKTGVVRIGEIAIPVELADSAGARARGLSGRQSLPPESGMLFIFDEPDRYGFWMKDMHFPIDIIWIDEAGRVVDITERLQPSTYPNSFSPSSPARYVLEVNAEFAMTHEIKRGMRAAIE